MLFSIITVAKDNLEGLKKTYESLKVQNFQSFEWIVVDGDSTDGSKEFLFTTDSDWLSEPDEGIYDAMNKGINHSGSDYLLFLNAGDEIADAKTLDHLAALIKNNPDFIFGDSLEDLGRGKKAYKKARPFKAWRQNMITHHQAMLYRREALEDVRYDPAYTIAADFDFTARFLLKGRTHAYLPEPVCVFKAGGVSQTNTETGREEQFQIREKLQLLPPALNKVLRALQKTTGQLRTYIPGLYWVIKSGGKAA